MCKLRLYAKFSKLKQLTDDRVCETDLQTLLT